MLGESTQLLVERWSGDLRRLRDEAERDPSEERKLLRQFRGLGDVGVDIFFREVQVAWDELRPRRVGDDDFPPLVAALIRVELADDHDAVVAAARR